MQIINAITGKKRKDGKPYKGWINHPCSVMWKDYVPALKHYTNVFIQEWINRGYNNNMEFYDTGKIIMQIGLVMKSFIHHIELIY